MILVRERFQKCRCLYLFLIEESVSRLPQQLVRQSYPQSSVDWSCLTKCHCTLEALQVSQYSLLQHLSAIDPKRGQLDQLKHRKDLNGQAREQRNRQK